MAASTIHLTNGDSAAAAMRLAGIEGSVLPWRDALHDGPVPAGLALEALSRVRAGFIAEQGWGEAEAVEREFALRDRALAGFGSFDEAVLWFEHDLYDQLQLIQILAWLAPRAGGATRLTLACEAEYLGDAAPARLRQRLTRRAEVSAAQLAVAERAWAAFTAPQPEALPAFVSTDTSPLPFLGPALARLLEERPAPADGLARSERQALGAIASGAVSLADAFVRSHHDLEDAVWLGDTTFAWYVSRLSLVHVPLVTLQNGEPVAPARGDGEQGGAYWGRTLVLTDAGRRVLEGRASHVALNGIDRWQGGVHFLQDPA
jgi:hypothetical protein